MKQPAQPPCATIDDQDSRGVISVRNKHANICEVFFDRMLSWEQPCKQEKKKLADGLQRCSSYMEETTKNYYPGQRSRDTDQQMVCLNLPLTSPYCAVSEPNVYKHYKRLT